MKKIITGLVILLVSFGLYQLFYPKTAAVADDQADLILFWGDGCPHCEKVKQYITDNKIDSRIKISFKEVYYNKSNQALLSETVKKCPEINTSQGIGVPLAYDRVNSRCLLGDQPIIDWLGARVLK